MTIGRAHSPPLVQDKEEMPQTGCLGLGRMLYALGNRQRDIPALRQLLEEILPS